MNDNKDIKILCVDDEAELLENLKETIEHLGYSALIATSAEEAKPQIKEHNADIAIIISDYKMPGTNGLDFRAQILDTAKDIPFAVLSGFISKEMALKGVENKICAFLDKPYSEDDIAALIAAQALERIESIREDRELLDGFVDDVTNLLEELEPLVLGLEIDPHDLESINRIYAIAHTIKGGSGFFDTVISKYVHAFEEVLTKLKSGKMEASKQVVSAMLQCFDRLGYLIQTIKTPESRDFVIENEVKLFDLETEDAAPSPGEATEEKGSSPPPLEAKQGKPAPQAKDWVKVRTSMLNEFMELSGEITVIRNMVNKLVKNIEKLYPGNKDISLLGELLDEMHKINSTMQDKITDLRKQPLRETFKSIPRLIRDLSSSLNKPLRLEISGEDVRVDAAIAEVLSSSLVHLIRNCADHGIEAPEKRAKTGKATEGTISIRASEKGEDVVVEIQDDGNGIDPKKIGNRAIEKGLVSAEEISRMNDGQIFSLIFESGFSTAETVSAVSGRGVGMDMVKGSVEKIGGTIRIDAVLGQGTKMTVQLPIPKSVMIIDSLFVKANGETLAIPQDDIGRLLILDTEKQNDQVKILEGTRVLKLANELIPLVHLGAVLNIPPKEANNDPQGEMNIVVVNSKGITFGIEVDEILNVEDAVVRKLEKHLEYLSTYIGATFLGDGGLALILNIEHLARLAKLKIAGKARYSAGTDLAIGNPNSAEFLLFELGCKGKFGVPLKEVFRLEEFSSKAVHYSGEQATFIYRNKTMPIVSVETALGFSNTSTSNESPSEKIPLIVYRTEDGFVGFSIKKITDIAVSNKLVDPSVQSLDGISGTVCINEKIVSVLNFSRLTEKGLHHTKPTPPLQKTTPKR